MCQFVTIGLSTGMVPTFSETRFRSAARVHTVAPGPVGVGELGKGVVGGQQVRIRGHHLGLRDVDRGLLEHAAACNLRTVMTFHQKVEEAAPMPPPSRRSCRKRPRSCTSPTPPTTTWPRRTSCRGPRSTRSSTSWRPTPTSPGPGVVGIAVGRPARGRTARSASTVRQRHRRRGPARTQSLPRLRAGPWGRRRHHRRARSGGHLLRRHPRLPGRDRAEHRPGAPPEPGVPVMIGSGRRERIDYAPSVSRAGPRRRARRRVAFTTVCSFKDR